MGIRVTFLSRSRLSHNPSRKRYKWGSTHWGGGELTQRRPPCPYGIQGGRYAGQIITYQPTMKQRQVADDKQSFDFFRLPVLPYRPTAHPPEVTLDAASYLTSMSICVRGCSSIAPHPHSWSQDDGTLVIVRLAHRPYPHFGPPSCSCQPPYQFLLQPRRQNTARKWPPQSPLSGPGPANYLFS